MNEKDSLMNKKGVLLLVLAAVLVLAGCEEKPTYLSISELRAMSFLWGEDTADKPSFTIMGDPDIFGIRLSWSDSTPIHYSTEAFTFSGNVITGTYIVDSVEYQITITAIYYKKTGLNLLFSGEGPLATLTIKGLQPGTPE